MWLSPLRSFAVALALLSPGACERPQDRPIEPDLPKLAPPEPADPGDTDADTGRTIGPIADVNTPAQAGTLGQSGTFGQGGGVGATGGVPGTGGLSIH